MRLNASTSLKLISFFPLTLLFLLSVYFVYSSYNEYLQVKKFDLKLEENRILKKLSINIAQERDLSAIYMGSKGKLAKNALVKQRKNTNRVIKEFNNFFKNRKIDKNINDIYRGLTKITKVRELINGLNIPFDKMFFDYYSKINKIIQIEYNKIEQIQLTPKISSEITFEAILFRKMEKSGKERGFIGYILAKEKPFTSDELSKWIKMYSDTDLSDINIYILNTELKNRLRSLFNSSSAKQTYQLLTIAKINIIEGSDIGYYQIKPSRWFALMSRKIVLLNSASNELYFQIKNDADIFFVNAVRPKLTIAAGILILTIFLLIVSFFIDRYIRRSIKELEKLFSKVAELADIDEEIDFQTADGIEKGYRIIEIAIDQIQQDKQIALEASKAKSIFLANMSHEIRTPLNGIIGFTELLKNTNISGEERDFVDIIEKSSENLLEIINNILDLSKIESDKIEIEEILFSPIAEFENAVEVFAAKAAEKNIRLSFYMDPSLNNYLTGDPVKIKEVLINLLSNAVKFTPQNGEIDVEIKRIGDVDSFGKTKVKFSVKDNGIGISEDKLKTIFDAFSQADSTITRKYGGTGLGLTISSKFIELMGGKLEVESEVGKGTKFFFTLEFDETPSNEYKFKDKFTEFKCGILTDKNNKHIHTQYIYDYLKYFGCDAMFFYDFKELKELSKSEDLNFIVLDTEYIDDDEIEKYKKTNLPGIIILKSSLQSVSSRYSTDLIKTVYEPVNVTKLVNTLQEQKELVAKAAKKEKEILEEPQSEEKFEQEPVFEKYEYEIKEEEKGKEDQAISESYEPIEKSRIRKIKILVAEDNDINRKLIKRTLENYNAEVILANDGKEALEEFKKQKFDIVFMDIAMPVMDGVKSLHEIIKYELDNGLKHTPIIALTANALKGDRERFLSEGFDEYITKPVKSKNIETVLDMFITQEQDSQKEELDITDKIVSDSKIYSDEKSYDEHIGLLDDNQQIEEQKEEYEISKEENELFVESDDLKESFSLEEESVEAFSVKSAEDEEEKKEEEIKEDFDKKETKKLDVETPDKRKRVLIAEDNAINQKLIEKTLKNFDLDVDIANNGEEALEKFKENRYDIVFMDISMPVMDGIEATHKILEYEKENNMSHTPIIALTANALPGDREAFLAEGLDEYIAKPLKKDDISRILKMFLKYNPDSKENKDEISIEENKDKTSEGSEHLDKIEENKDLHSIENLAKQIDSMDHKDEVNNIQMVDEKPKEEFSQKDVLVYKNNKIESKILANMISKMGYSVSMVNSYDDFIFNMDENQYKVLFVDKDLEYVDIDDVLDKIEKLDKIRDSKTYIVEFVNSLDEKGEKIQKANEVLDNIINKKSIRTILEKYITKVK